MSSLPTQKVKAKDGHTTYVIGPVETADLAEALGGNRSAERPDAEVLKANQLAEKVIKAMPLDHRQPDPKRELSGNSYIITLEEGADGKLHPTHILCAHRGEGASKGVVIISEMDAKHPVGVIKLDKPIWIPEAGLHDTADKPILKKKGAEVIQEAIDSGDIAMEPSRSSGIQVADVAMTGSGAQFSSQPTPGGQRMPSGKAPTTLG